jgi:hypothetical protein
MTEAPHIRFMALHTRLATLHPDAIREAQALAAATVNPATASPDAIWRVLWDKPLYANARVSLATRWVAEIEQEMKDAWKILGADPKVFRIRHVTPGVKRECFAVHGSLAEGFVARHGIALHRLYRIQGAATALRARAARHDYPFADIVGSSLSETIPRLQNEFGPGWGPITVLHALTDMGLAVKPDLHLVNTMRVLKLSVGLSDRKVPAIGEALMINRDVRALLQKLGRAESPQELRYIDKVLMDLSHRGVLTVGPEGA